MELKNTDKQENIFVLLTENPSELFFKYFIEAFVIALAAYIIPNKKITFSELAVVTLVSIVTLMLLDMYSSTVAMGTRFGAGLGIGYNLVTTVPKWKIPFM